MTIDFAKGCVELKFSLPAPDKARNEKHTSDGFSLDAYLQTARLKLPTPKRDRKDRRRIVPAVWTK